MSLPVNGGCQRKGTPGAAASSVAVAKNQQPSGDRVVPCAIESGFAFSIRDIPIGEQHHQVPRKRLWQVPCVMDLDFRRARRKVSDQEERRTTPGARCRRTRRARFGTNDAQR